MFESIISRPAPPPAPLFFSSMLVEKKKAPLKASTVLNMVTPTLLATSFNPTKSTKTPSLGSQRKSSLKLSPQQNKTISTKPPPRPSPTRNKPSNWSACQHSHRLDQFRTRRHHTFHRYEHCFAKSMRNCEINPKL